MEIVRLVIVLEKKILFENLFRPRLNAKPSFSNFSGGRKYKNRRLCFRISPAGVKCPSPKTNYLCMNFGSSVM